MQHRTAPSIAVIIPVYRAHYLATCLASVFAQTLSRPRSSSLTTDRRTVWKSITRWRHTGIG
jgi:hypothetical protein